MQDRRRRFELEARAAGGFNHPNIVAVYDVGHQDGTHYVVSELLEGETLRARLGEAPLPTHRALDYALQVARGLAAAHEHGVVHRDLKPENLFVTRDGLVKILDFGLAKLTQGEEAAPGSDPAGLPTLSRGTSPGTMVGTVGYMSPEQVRGQAADHRSDIFSLGTILYEMFAGRRAFQRASAVETLNAILKEDPPNLFESTKNVSPALERIVRRCLEKRPEERFRTAHDLAIALDAISTSSTRSFAAEAVGTESDTRYGERRSRLLERAGLLLAGAGLAEEADGLEERRDGGAQALGGADVGDLDRLVPADAVEATDALLDGGRGPGEIEENEAVAELEVAPFAAALGGQQQRRAGRKPELRHLDVPLAG